MARKQSGPQASRLVAWSLFGWCSVAASAAAVLGWRIGVPLTETLSGPLVAVVFGFVGALVASRQSRNAVGWIFLAVAAFYELHFLTVRYARLGLLRDPLTSEMVAYPAARPDPLPLAAEAAWVAQWTWLPGLVALVTFVPLLFPDGRPPSPRWRWAGWAAGTGIVLAVVPFGVAAWPVRGSALLGDLDAIPELRWAAYPFAAGVLVAGVAAVASVLALVVRFRRSRGVERQQLKWFLFAAVVLVVVTVNAFTPLNAPEWVLNLAIPGIAVAAGIAILRYRLYDIDLVINRSVVYAVLTALVVGTYIAVVTLLGRLFEPSGLPVALVATGVVAVIFQPLRERLQRAVNRLMYGERDDPYTALSLLGRKLQAAIPADEILPQVTETVATTLRVPYAAIELRRDDGFEPAACHGHPVPDPLHLPLVYQGETVGRIVVGPRGPGESFSAADVRLLEDLARAAGVAVHAVRLTADLERSRERLVVAREEERRRLRRELHDGLGPALAGVGLQIETVQALVRDDPDAADALLAKLKHETQAAVSSIRTIAYNLRPPALDELGLVGALREEGTRFADGRGLQVSISAPDHLPALPAAVEVAAYRIAFEAITNASRHAGAKTCVVRVAANDGLDVDVRDDGHGLPLDFRPGVGVISMRERATELGGTLTIEDQAPGGTRILAHFPLGRP